MKMIFKKFRNLEKGTIVRGILMVLTWINQGMIMLGTTPWAITKTYVIISFILTVLVTAITYWYNNSFTSLAQMAQDIYHILKDGNITPEEFDEFIKKHGTKRKHYIEHSEDEVKDDDKHICDDHN